MRKSLLTLGAAAFALSSFASTRVLYQQNFETATSPSEAGWSDFRGIQSIASDSFGKFYEANLNGQNCGTTFLKWGQDIYLNDGTSILENNKYDLQFEFNIYKSSSNQYNGAITVFTNHDGVANQPYRTPWSPAGYWENFVYDMSQVDQQTQQFVVDGGTIVTEGENGEKTYAINYEDPTTFDLNVWYRVELNVDVESREVEYSVISTADGEIVKSGTLNVPENDVNGDPISMYAEGLFLTLSRTTSIYQIDNILVSFETSYEWANKPTIALTGMGKTEDDQPEPTARKYTISFLEGETLHVLGTDGQEITVDYDECEEGNYTYFTTTSGVIKAWTTVGEAKSEVVEATVECVAYVLPAAEVTIVAVREGFGKTYTLTVSNADVPMRPDIFINYEFVGVNGEKVSAEGETSGTKVTVTEEGTLTITTEAFGYESKTISVKNEQEFKQKKIWDFARLTHDEITAHLTGGVWGVTNSSSTSGFNSWTGRGELYYNVAGTGVENEDGEMVYEKYKPFGFVSEDNTVQVLNTCLIDRAAIPETAKNEYFEGLTIFPDRGKVDEGGLPNVGIIEHIGLYNDQTKNNYNNVVVNDLEANDFIYVNAMANYGRGDNSNHPICSTDAEYYEQLQGGTDVVISVADAGVLNEETNLYDVTYALYRIDTALMKIVVYQPVGEGDAVEAVEAVAGDNNWYSIDGIRVAQPTRPGLYIHNGKKIIVK
ncbi:MAG: hypothetical protein K2K23_02640 [Muribaculaceae bacterium]|nr:hypothetical protein [Muribaculaceae bacterium]